MNTSANTSGQSKFDETSARQAVGQYRKEYGRNPTQRELRRICGGGSFSTITKFYEVLMAEESERRKAIEDSGLSEEMTNAVICAITKVVRECRLPIIESLKATIDTLQADVNELVADQRTAELALDAKDRDIANLSNQVTDLQKQLEVEKSHSAHSKSRADEYARNYEKLQEKYETLCFRMASMAQTGNTKQAEHSERDDDSADASCLDETTKQILEDFFYPKPEDASEASEVKDP